MTMMTMMMMMKVDGDLQKEMDERNLRPRLCYLTKGERGYGFHLHGERGSGAQFIRRIEAGSPAELAGLRSGDRVVEVNGENVEKESHHQVVQKIMEVENRTRLLVVDRETDEFLLLHSLPCTEDLAVEMSCLSSPRISSSSLASSTLSFTSSLRDSLTPSPSDSIALSPRDFTAHSLSDTITSLMLPQSTTSSPPGSIDPLPGDSIIPSPQNSTPSPEDSINQSAYESITQFPINPITEPPFNPITPSPTNPITPSPTNPITPSPTNPITPSQTTPITPSQSNPITPSPTNPITPSPTNPITPSQTNSITPSPTNPITPSPTNPITPSPTNPITLSPTNPITPSQTNPITPSPTNPITPSPTNPITPSPFDFITPPLLDTFTTPFSRKKSDETHIIDHTGTTDNQRSGSEDTVMRDLRPRLCHIVKNEQGFGFNLHCDKQRVGQYIRSVDPDSPAHRAGLQPGDRLVQVNGRSIKGLKHSDVVKIIREGGEYTRLLVVDPETDELFKKLGITPTPAHLNEDCVDGPVAPPSSCPVKGGSVSTSVIRNVSPSRSPITNLDVIKPPIRNESLKQQSHVVSCRSNTSETSVQMMERNSAPGVQEMKMVKEDLDPLWASGLSLSPTAAEARQKVSSKKANKRAPPMAWNKKYEIFCNF